MPDTLLAAFALVFVLEGFLPLVAPRLWRETFQRMLALSDGQLRFVGLAAVLVGVIALNLAT
ncbi:MAG: DUF2065 family protein [Casimicrobiaceae bacterium]